MKTRLPKPQKLPSGMYCCQVMVDGKRVSVVETDPDTAQARAIALKTGLIEDSRAPKGGATLERAIDLYIEDRRNVLSPSTLYGYRQIQLHRFKKLMKCKVHDISEPDIQRAINEDAVEVGSKTLKNAAGLVVAVVGQYKPINTKRLRFPQAVRKEHAYLDAQQCVSLITASEGNRSEIPILLAVWLGMRRSEILGLHWESVDFARKQLRVERALVVNEHNTMIEKSQTKNESSQRTLDCPDYILSKLDQYQPDPALRHGRIFTMYPTTFYDDLKKVCEKAGIPFVGIHGLRHTNASVMLSLGIVDKVAMARGGWSTKETMERIYQHIFLCDAQQANETINSFFEEKLHTNLHTES